ncbi:MAG: hypothetical protein LBL52_03640 [Rickettsiales bacterium]|jgi:hypothetical protein|nr:hypothetical protein [Rickettsiales bacterium]
MLSKNLSVLAYSNGFTLWHYKSPEVAERVEAEGYFVQVASILSAGDVMFVSFEDGGGRRTVFYNIGDGARIRRMQ